MRFSSVKNKFFKLCEFDKELLSNSNRRPYLVILRLKYNGKRQDFAIPFRSNIPSHVSKELYFSLPPRPTTKEGNIHGLHYIKMFPIKKEFLEKFNTDSDKYYEKILNIINKNKDKIIEQAQKYIDDYENGGRVSYCTNIHQIYLTINNIEVNEEVAATSENVN